MTEKKTLPAIPLYLINPKDGSELVLVPGGWFWMGTNESDPIAEKRGETPVHLHYVEPYYIGVACVMVGQFRKFVKETNYAGGEYNAYWGKWEEDQNDYPVRYVNWHDAQAYGKWADLRLPTEAEWELAGRGYEGRKYAWGNDWDSRRVCCDMQKGPKGETVPSYAHPEGAGPFGTLQQNGNVWEWCEDVYDEKSYERYAAGKFRLPKKGGEHVLRGGGYNDNRVLYFSLSFRGYHTAPYKRLPDCGFRMARIVKTME